MNRPIEGFDIHTMIEQSGKYEHDCVEQLAKFGVIDLGNAFLSSGVITNASVDTAIKSDVEDREALLRHILRCPDGEDLAEHARAVRAMADSLIKIAGQ